MRNVNSKNTKLFFGAGAILGALWLFGKLYRATDLTVNITRLDSIEVSSNPPGNVTFISDVEFINPAYPMSFS